MFPHRDNFNHYFTRLKSVSRVHLINTFVQAPLHQAILDGSPPWVVSPQVHFPRTISNPSVRVVKDHPSHSICPSHIASRLTIRKHKSFRLAFITGCHHRTSRVFAEAKGGCNARGTEYALPKRRSCGGYQQGLQSMLAILSTKA